MQSLPSKFIFFLLMLSTKLHIKADNDRQEQHDPTMLEMLTTGYIPDGGVVVRHHTTLGIIQGLQESSVGGASVVSHYYAFRGIPYADSPDGDLRFSDPVDAVESWPNRYLDATRYGNVCLQVDPTSSKILGEEDCLFLNVFTPLLTKTENPSNGDGLPVLVFIHGGGFLRGSSLGLAGGRLTSQNIVLVTMNYRLGALGFLSSGDTTIPGNFGLLDQLSALRWVQRNIAQFGGDPNRVTLGGFSAGATSVHSHLLSPLAKGGILAHNDSQIATTYLFAINLRNSCLKFDGAGTKPYCK
ncbi:Carboxylesterase 5A [Halocaridina rubra]|uniref:Carboxylic ester hydrolase n=1 Tax=Halocaridina rubra TaxID=373956 RepID=A0AAN9ADK0_HALRR